jgi:DNA repair exonuclease SbcCD ATPase subunit
VKLARLEVTNFRKLQAVEIDVEGNVVEISGKNASGKSSLLDAPWVLLKGLSQKDSIRPTPTRPIHDGCEQAVIKGTFKGKDVGLIVTRTFKTSEKDPKGWTSKLEVTNLEGLMYKVPPQQQLDAIIGEHRLDPIEFINLDAKEQLNAFRVFVKDIDFEGVEEKNAEDYESRTEIGRTITRLKNAAAAIVVPPGTPDAEIDVNELVEQLNSAGEKNTEIAREMARRESEQGRACNYDQQSKEITKQITALTEQIEVLKEKRKRTEAAATETRKALSNLPELPEPIDSTPIAAQIQAANATNANVRRKLEKKEHEAEVIGSQKTYDALTKAMEQRKADLEKSIKSAKLPLPGIGFGKGGLLLNGIPLKEASTAEQIRVAVALSLSLNPKLQLMWVRDASLLDDDTLAEIYRLAEEHDCNVLLETVRPQSGSAIVLEDGRVAKLTELEMAVAK